MSVHQYPCGTRSTRIVLEVPFEYSNCSWSVHSVPLVSPPLAIIEYTEYQRGFSQSVPCEHSDCPNVRTPRARCEYTEFRL